MATTTKTRPTREVCTRCDLPLELDEPHTIEKNGSAHVSPQGCQAAALRGFGVEMVPPHEAANRLKALR